MKCDHHPDRDTDELCSECYKPVCGECSRKVDGKTTCNDCLANTGAGVKEEHPPAHTETAAEPAVPPVGSPVPGPEDLPAEEIKCNECGTSLDTASMEKVGENTYCKGCVQKAKENISQALADMTRNINWPGAVAAGLVTAALGAVIWDRVETWFHIRIGLIAIAIGYCVALAVMWGAGGKRGVGLQVISVILTLAGIIGGLFLSFHNQVLAEAAKGTFPLPANPGADWLLTIMVFPLIFRELGFITWIIIAFGLYQGFVMRAMPKIGMPGASEQ